MSKVINISDLLSSAKPSIQIGQKVYPVNDGVDVVLAFEEQAGKGIRGLLGALESALGADAYAEIGVESYPIANIQVLATAVLAAQMGISYEDAAARFRRQDADGN